MPIPSLADHTVIHVSIAIIKHAGAICCSNVYVLDTDPSAILHVPLVKSTLGTEDSVMSIL